MIKHTLLALAAGALLAACGDSPPSAETTPPASNEVPASATASTAAWSQYAASLSASETKEPLDVNKVSAPTSETESPQAL